MATLDYIDVLHILKRHYGIDDETVSKIFALGWGSQFIGLKHIGPMSQKVLDNHYGYDYSAADSRVRDFVFSIIGERHDILSLTRTRENGLTMLDMMVIPSLYECENRQEIDMRTLVNKFSVYWTSQECKISGLKYVKRMTNKAIAEALNIHSNTVGGMLWRARSKIKDQHEFIDLMHQIFKPEYFQYREANQNGEFPKVPSKICPETKNTVDTVS